MGDRYSVEKFTNHSIGDSASQTYSYTPQRSCNRRYAAALVPDITVIEKWDELDFAILYPILQKRDSQFQGCGISIVTHEPILSKSSYRIETTYRHFFHA